jgi:hypothetical protein
MKKTQALRIVFALVSLAALAFLLPVLGTILLGLLTLLLPMLRPVLVLLSLVFVADRLRGKREPAAATGTEPVSIGAPALHSPAR